ncbi:putative spermidine/putrescine transport system ATP-binding protein [Leucobacter luti]|uniref:ABC-type quaternary amine transporter n=1 Tax=Leucobacter luti TaxID=340320 RepID=A0A4R6RVC2_9MICO|nr:ATP-binding cassette domain-containing protein [Leucobacter luti]TDP90921.1 putative spermidine/putrescine transport system ATP-binding protein [Leucobacter luti]
MPEQSNRGAEIRLDGVSKHYPKSIALDDVTLTVEPGEFMTFLGPSGSGKTTTLNLIAGFTDLTTGSVRIDGKQMADVPVHKRDLGIVFQHYALFPHMSVFDNVAFPLARRKTSKSDTSRLVQEALDTAGLNGYADRYPAELSGGQQQRVALARALVFQPKVLLLDEPLGALDKNLRERLQLELRRIHREVGRTFVFVTHDQEEALTLSDRIAVFNDGRIEQVGTAKELYEQPASLFVAGFIGESTMVPAASGSGFAVVRPEHGELFASATAVPVGMQSVPVTIRQSVYLGSGWKHEIVLENPGLADPVAGVIRGVEELDWLTGSNTPAQLAWHPEQVATLAA